ncbi:hypothetical protein H0A36_01400 [Endozoicomonas sp. SM1973]|uniref:Uncharacterized protein n=1 Tax=Spartinivicinus marinus TaxID=2994442 RepID=A0A853HTN8_9GAMM|nr:hypothetical protein [Spartinivicinus marinus]MCX4026809.1 hypothetical protein [Spartinivicinus marinus]NYZ64643.1 hypothetical protein [Spartinivicinus marinus]
MVVIAVLIFTANVYATFVVAKTYFEIKQRRLYQILFIWLVPVIGAALAIYLNLEEYFEQKRSTQIGNSPNITDAQAVTFAIGSDR